MSYTITSAQFANPLSTAAIIFTVEAGAVAITPADQDLWDQMLGMVPPPAPYAAPPEVLPDISRRQFYQGLAMPPYMVITENEALLAMQGTVPASLLALVEQMPTEQRFGAKMLLAGALNFQRSHPMVEFFANAQLPPWPSEKTDTFWRFCSALL